MAMKQVSIQSLKAALSATIAEAEAGETIEITRHNEAVARLVPVAQAHAHRGALVGAGRLRPAVRRGSRGRYLAALREDRNER